MQCGMGEGRDLVPVVLGLGVVAMEEARPFEAEADWGEERVRFVWRGEERETAYTCML